MVIGADINWAFAVGSEERCGLVSMLAFPSTSEVMRNKYVFPDVSRSGGIVIEVFAVLNVVEDKNSNVALVPLIVPGGVPTGKVLLLPDDVPTGKVLIGVPIGKVLIGGVPTGDVVGLMMATV
jgi:hypothetical protein